MLTKLNNWYDNLGEPKRFWFFFIFVAVPFSVALFNAFNPQYQFMPLWISGSIFLFVFGLAVYRMIRQM